MFLAKYNICQQIYSIYYKAKNVFKSALDCGLTAFSDLIYFAYIIKFRLQITASRSNQLLMMTNSSFFIHVRRHR